MIDCRDCSEMVCEIDSEDGEMYYHCENENRHISNIHENITEAPNWCKYRGSEPKYINE